MVDWLGLVIPLVYLSILVGSLATFSSFYRRRKAAAAASLEPWFPPHLQRNIYLSLLHMEPSSASEKSVAVPDSVLKAALLERACEDFRRIVQIRNAKGPLSTLLQRGSVGDELWQRFLRAEKEIEAELRDVVEEANAYQPGWGQVIFQSANEMVNNAVLRERVTASQARAKPERERWEKERAEIQSRFMKELDEEDGDGTTSTATATTATATRPGSSGDDDAVLVDSPAVGAAGGAGGSKNASKKKKGKK